MSIRFGAVAIIALLILACTGKIRLRTETIELDAEGDICSAKDRINKGLCPMGADNVPPVESIEGDCGRLAWLLNRSCIKARRSLR